MRDSNLVGRRISELRNQHGWSQETFASLLQRRGCFITRDMLANIENGRASASDTQLGFFALVLGVPVSQLFPKNLPLALAHVHQTRHPRDEEE